MSAKISERAGAVPYAHSVAGCLDGAIGAHGLSEAELAPWIERLAPALQDLQADYRERRLPLLRVAEDEADIVAAEAALTKLSAGARAVIFFGTGGSGLGGQTLAQLGGWNIPGLADESQKNRPRTRFYDNLDPVTLESALGTFALDTARFVVTSKSGGTPETLAQALAAMSAVRAAGLEARIPALFLGITEPRVAGKANGLRDLFEGLRIPVLDHHPGIGGRFSVLTNVGLVPALAGIIVCPSNPWLSVDPILAVPGLREAMRASGRPVIAVSPIIAGKAVKGPTAKIMQELGLHADAVNIARHYAGLIDGFVIDAEDRTLMDKLAIPTRAAHTLMTTLDDKIALARDCLDFCAGLGRRFPLSPLAGRGPG